MAENTPDLASPDQLASPPKKSFLRRTLTRILRVLVIVYVLICIIMLVFQEKLIFPGSFSQGSADAEFKMPLNAERLTLSAGSTRIVALFGTALDAKGNPVADPASFPTILYFYGNGNNLSSTVWEFDQFRKLGANVMIPEYPGYGLSGGKPSESGCYAASQACYEHLKSRKDIDPSRIFTAGWSLGAAVACDTAFRHPDLNGVMMFSAFTSLDDVGRKTYPFLPVSAILRHHFYSEKKIAEIRMPILLMHGADDALVPFPMSARLRDAAKLSRHVTYIPIPGAGHNDFYSLGEPEILPAMKKFLTEAPGFLP